MKAFSLENETVILTGAAGGIGAAVARVLQDQGARLVLADYHAGKVEDVARSIDPTGQRVVGLGYDATRPQDADAVVSACLSRFGRLDHLVPAAAIFEDQPFVTMSDEQWERMIAVNLNGVFYICRRAVPHMAEGGSITTIASSAGHEGASPLHVHYGASKGGILGLMKTLARELAPKIRVNNISPGVVDTPMVTELLKKDGAKWLAATPAGRFATGEDIGHAVAFLCSRAADHILGQTIHVNGGLYMGG